MNQGDMQDQIKLMVDMAELVYTYYRNLVKEGFSAEQALVLTRDWQNTMISEAFRSAAQMSQAQLKDKGTK